MPLATCTSEAHGIESLPVVYAIKNQFSTFAQRIDACYGIMNFSYGEKSRAAIAPLADSVIGTPHLLIPPNATLSTDGAPHSRIRWSRE